MGCASTEQKKEFDYSLRQDEIIHIKASITPEKLEEIKNSRKKKSIREREDKILPLMRKVDFTFTKKNVILKEYMVLYLGDNFNKDIVEYDYVPTIFNLSEYIEKKEYKEYLKYAKVNNDNKAVMSLECKEVKQYENYENSEKILKTFLKFKILESDKKTNLITLEFYYDIKFIFDKYGFLFFEFYYSDVDWVTTTISFSFDNNFQISDVSKEDFKEISEYKLYSFGKIRAELFLRNTDVKLKIENELDKQLLSKFSADEINQINTSLNLIKYHRGKNLVYTKVIHRFEEFDKILIYNIIVYPLNTDSFGDYGSFLFINQPQSIVINQLKINNVVVEKTKKEVFEENHIFPNEEDNGEPNEDEGKIVKGYYCSKEEYMGQGFAFKGTIALFEFDCYGVYFYNQNYQINCYSFGCFRFEPIYGASFRYELILNEKVKFPHRDFNLMAKDGKIILEGMIDGNKDNFNQEKFEELAKLYDRNSYINEKDEEDKMQYWMELKLMDTIPEYLEYSKLIE